MSRRLNEVGVTDYVTSSMAACSYVPTADEREALKRWLLAVHAGDGAGVEDIPAWYKPVAAWLQLNSLDGTEGIKPWSLLPEQVEYFSALWVVSLMANADLKTAKKAEQTQSSVPMPYAGRRGVPRS